jgi:hypothetical protein
MKLYQQRNSMSNKYLMLSNTGIVIPVGDALLFSDNRWIEAAHE